MHVRAPREQGYKPYRSVVQSYEGEEGDRSNPSPPGGPKGTLNDSSLDIILGVILSHLGGHRGLSEALLEPSWAILDAPMGRRAPRPGPGEGVGQAGCARVISDVLPLPPIPYHGVALLYIRTVAWSPYHCVDRLSIRTVGCRTGQWTREGTRCME